MRYGKCPTICGPRRFAHQSGIRRHNAAAIAYLGLAWFSIGSGAPAGSQQYEIERLGAVPDRRSQKVRRPKQVRPVATAASR